MSAPKDSEGQLHQLLSTLADDLATVTDEKLLEDDPISREEAESIRKTLLLGFQKGKKERLRAAALQHEESARRVSRQGTLVPRDPALRRLMLENLLQGRPEISLALTVQHRDFKELTDADVESALRQLEHLGVLDKDSDPSKT